MKTLSRRERYATAHRHLSSLSHAALIAELRALGTDDEDNEAPHLYAHEAADRLEKLEAEKEQLRTAIQARLARHSISKDECDLFLREVFEATQ